MKTKYKKHLSSTTTIFALCGSHTSAKKFNLEGWLKFAPRDRCPKCEAVQNMVQHGSVRKPAVTR